MKKKGLYIILASQDFDSANHRNLWLEMAEQSGQEVIVANIHADYIVSRIKHKTYRIKEAKSPPVKVSEHLSVMRPLLWIRQELLPESMNWIARKGFWDSVKHAVPDVMNRHVKLLVYNACWVSVLYGSHPDIKIGYYLFDEVRYEGRDGGLNKKRYKLDEFACRHSDVIYTMTQKLTDSRKEYNDNIITLGNGAVLPVTDKLPLIRFPRSIAFIGNFRDWIDQELLTSLIEFRRDILFAFVGTCDPNMQTYRDMLLDKYSNTIFYGKVSKDRMPLLYQQFDGVIIPYRNNEFIKATRPIKIVESIISGVPVITVPMDGYKECEYIRFAQSMEEFSSQIDYIMSHPIDKNSETYKNFVYDNTWSNKAKIILSTL